MRTFVRIVLLLLLTAGCGGSHSTRQGSGTVSRPKSAGPCLPSDLSNRKNPVLHGDIDADGQDDEVFIEESGPERRPRCRFVVVAETANGRLRGRIWQEELRSPVQTEELGLPRLETLREIDRRPGLEAVITVSESATTRYAALFSYRRGAFMRLVLTGVGLVAPNVFPVGGAVTATSDVDCSLNAKPGEVVVLTSSVLDPKNDTWLVTHRFFEAGSAGLSLARTERRRLPDKGKQWEEGSIFGQCPERSASQSSSLGTGPESFSLAVLPHVEPDAVVPDLVDVERVERNHRREGTNGARRAQTRNLRHTRPAQPSQIRMTERLRMGPPGLEHPC